MGATLSDKVLLGDMLKVTGYNCPAGHYDDKVLDLIEGGGDVTLETLTATENKVYTPAAGKAYSKVTVNVPVKLFCWKETEGALIFTKTATPTTSNKAYVPAAGSLTAETISAVGEGSITYDGTEYTRYSTGDLTLV